MLHFENSDRVIINARRILDSMDSFFDHSARQVRDEIDQEIAKLEEQLKPLEEEKKNLDEKALRRANRMIALGVVGLSSQFAILARLTWWELNWDIMEPITYFITFGTGVFAFAFYISRKQAYTFYALREVFFQRSLGKAMVRSGFDREKYRALHQRLSELKS